MRIFTYRPTQSAAELLNDVPRGLRNRYINNAVLAHQQLIDNLAALAETGNDTAHVTARLLIRMYNSHETTI